MYGLRAMQKIGKLSTQQTRVELQFISKSLTLHVIDSIIVVIKLMQPLYPIFQITYVRQKTLNKYKVLCSSSIGGAVCFTHHQSDFLWTPAIDC